MAAGDVKLKEGTAIVWADTGADEVLDLGTANGNAAAVCVGAYHDWGVAPRANEYKLRIFIDGFDTAPVVGEQVLVYISESDAASNFSGPESPSDTSSGAGNINRLPNMLGPFIATVHSTTAGADLIATYRFESAYRYHAPVVHNNTANKLLSTSDAHTVTITPVFANVEQ